MPAVYVFGSRIRGDHHLGSDVNMVLFQEEWNATSENVEWWQAQSMAEYCDLGDALPGPLHLLLETFYAARETVLAARADPACVVLQVRKAGVPLYPTEDPAAYSIKPSAAAAAMKRRASPAKDVQAGAGTSRARSQSSLTVPTIPLQARCMS